ncbi:hypothetical protein [Euzebya sp.]|uniref:hypothetical protein n=1 Tax=Euzebya sp. TaxID=1971409 RepID=UPI00351183E8
MTPEDIQAAMTTLAELIGHTVARELRGDVQRLLVPAENDVLEGIEDIATYLTLSPAHVARHLGSTIPARKVGRSWLASKAALTAWLAGRDP